MSNTTIQREFHPAIKVLNAKQGLVEYVASDESVDSGREVILASGWSFDRLSKNPIFVNSHNYWGVEQALGRVEAWRVDREKRQLIEVVRWAIDVEQNALAQLGFAMTEKGYLKACSIGAVVLGEARRDTPEFAEALKGTRLSEAEKLSVWRVITKQDQYELSACVVGANPNAVARAFKDGAVPESLMARCGFDDQGFEVLDVAAKICARDDIDDTLKAAARINVAALMLRGARQGKGFSDRTNGVHNDRSPDTGQAGAPAGTEDAAKRARENREAWMKEANRRLAGIA